MEIRSALSFTSPLCCYDTWTLKMIYTVTVCVGYEALVAVKMLILSSGL
jgi:hypothetical protein